MQLIESHAGLVILATNMKSNIDAAFMRRFHSLIEFEIPDFKERLNLWKKYFPKNKQPSKPIDFEKIAREYRITGANIVNIIQYAGLQAISKNRDFISEQDLMEGIRKEYKKENRLSH